MLGFQRSLQDRPKEMRCWVPAEGEREESPLGYGRGGCRGCRAQCGAGEHDTKAPRLGGRVTSDQREGEGEQGGAEGGAAVEGPLK